MSDENQLHKSENDYGFVYTEKWSSPGTKMLVSVKVVIFFLLVDFHGK